MTHRAWTTILLVHLATLAGSVSAETGDWNLIEAQPLKWKMELTDEAGHECTLKHWVYADEYYFTLRDNEAKSVTLISAASVEIVPAVYKDQEYQVKVREDQKFPNGSFSPAVYEVRKRKVLVEPESSIYSNPRGTCISIVRGRVVTQGTRKYRVISPLPPPGANLKDANPNTIFNAETAAADSPAVELTLTDPKGESCVLYVWNIDEKTRHLVLAHGEAVTRKFIATDFEEVPGVYEERTRQKKVKPERVVDGKVVEPAWYETEGYRICLKPPKSAYSGAQGKVEISPGQGAVIAGQQYSIRRETLTENRAPPARAPKEEKF